MISGASVFFLFHREPVRAHREHVRQMMRSFSDPFGGHLMPSTMDGRSRGHNLAEGPSSSLALRDEHWVRACYPSIHLFIYLFSDPLNSPLLRALKPLMISVLEKVLSLLKLYWELATDSVTGAEAD